jgi:hypothetical protein
MFATMIMFVGTVFVLNAASTPANAQFPNKRSAHPFALPVLTDTDFQNILEYYRNFKWDPVGGYKFSASKGIDPTRFSGVINKIYWNIMGLNQPDLLAKAEESFGDSVYLNSEEQVLFDKYKDEITTLLSTP